MKSNEQKGYEKLETSCISKLETSCISKGKAAFKDWLAVPENINHHEVTIMQDLAIVPPGQNQRIQDLIYHPQDLPKECRTQQQHPYDLPKECRT